MTRDFDRVRGTVHDLESALALSDLADQVLIVSPRTLYVLNNLAAGEVGWLSRWQVSLSPSHFVPVQPHSQAELAVNLLTDQLRLELMPINPDLIAALEDIAAALAGLQLPSVTVNNQAAGGGCGQQSTVFPLANCISGMTPAELMDTENLTAPNPAGSPPDGYNTWEEWDTYKCNAAWLIVRGLENICDNGATMTIANLTVEAAQGALLGVALWMGLTIPPLALAAGAAALAAIAAVSVAGNSAFTQVAAYVRSHEQALVCALYNSADAAAAVDALSSVIEDAIQAITWEGPLAALAGPIAPLIATVLAAVETNSFVQPLFHTVATLAALNETCNCQPGCGWYIKFGSGDGIEIASEFAGGSYYVEVALNATGENQYCGSLAVVDEMTVVSGTFTQTGGDSVRVWNQQGSLLQSGTGFPTTPFNCGDMALASSTPFTVRVRWH